MNGINKYGTQSRLNSELRLLRSARMPGPKPRKRNRKREKTRSGLFARRSRQVQRLRWLTFNRATPSFFLHQLLVSFTCFPPENRQQKIFELDKVFNKNYVFQIACLCGFMTVVIFSLMQMLER